MRFVQQMMIRHHVAVNLRQRAVSAAHREQRQSPEHPGKLKKNIQPALRQARRSETGSKIRIAIGSDSRSKSTKANTATATRIFVCRVKIGAAIFSAVPSTRPV